MLGDSDFSNLTRLHSPYDLAHIGLVCITANTTLGIYANYRQLKHISSRAWRPPVKIRTLLLNEKVDPDLVDLSNDLGVRKIRRRLHMQIGAAVTGWLQSSVFLLGGYDALLRFTHTAAATLPHWLNHGPGTLSETLISTAVYCFSFPIIGLLVSYPVATIYKKIVPLPDDKTSLGGDVTENLRFDGIQLAKWRVWGIGFAGYVLSAGIPALATTAVYERLGAQKSTAFLKGMLWVGGGILLLLDGGVACFLLYCVYNKDKRPAVPTDKSHLFSTVTEWRAKNDVPYDIEAFEKRLQGILLKSATGCRLPLTVQVVEKEPADGPVKVLGQVQEDDQDPALNRLLSPYLRIMSDRQFLRLHGRQLRGLGYEQNLALAASVLVDDQALTLGHIFRTIVVPQVNMIIMLLPFPLMHMFYVARPDSIRGIFPSLSPLSHHIPLVCSWSTTSSILPHMTWILEVWSSYVNTRQTLNVDKRVAALGPEFVRGWVSLLEARETTKKSKEENGDMGTRDKLYGWLYGNSLQPTRRLLEMQKYL